MFPLKIGTVEFGGEQAVLNQQVVKTQLLGNLDYPRVFTGGDASAEQGITRGFVRGIILGHQAERQVGAARLAQPLEARSGIGQSVGSTR